MRREAPRSLRQDKTRREKQSREDKGEERERDASAFVESRKGRMKEKSNGVGALPFGQEFAVGGW